MPGVIISYGPAASAVPALSAAATAGLAAVAAAVGVAMLRKRAPAGPLRLLALAAVAGSLAATGFGGNALISSVQATQTQDAFSNPAGGTLTYDSVTNPSDTWSNLGYMPLSYTTCGQTSGNLTNSSGAPLQINQVNTTLSDPPGTTIDTNDSDYSLNFAGNNAPRCTPGSTTLQPNQSCQVILVTPCLG